MQNHRDQLHRQRMEIANDCQGSWEIVLPRLGVSDEFFRPRRAGPCPICGGTDRYMWRGGEIGLWACRHCPKDIRRTGFGMALAMGNQAGLSWSEICDQLIQARTGVSPQEIAFVRESRQREAPNEERTKQRIDRILAGCKHLRLGDGSPADLYLKSRVRGLDQLGALPDDVLWHPAHEYRYESASGWQSFGVHPALIVRCSDGERVTGLHQTYLTSDGRKLPLCTRDGELLTDRHGQPLPQKKLYGHQGVAKFAMFGEPGPLMAAGEGLETCLRGMVLTRGMPTCFAVSTSGIRNLRVPDSVRKLVLFEDNDAPDTHGNRAGRCATLALKQRDDIAKRIAQGSLHVVVRTTIAEGTDLADV